MIVLNDVVFSIVDYIRKDPNLIISSIDNYDNKKLIIGLDVPNKTTLMIEILPSGVCDVSVLSELSGDYLFSKADVFENMQDLERHIFKFISDFKGYN